VPIVNAAKCHGSEYFGFPFYVHVAPMAAGKPSIRFRNTATVASIETFAVIHTEGAK